MMAGVGMQTSSPAAFRSAAWLGFLGVALGAVGAHAMQDYLAHRSMITVWEKAVFYHFIHAVVMLLLACVHPFAKGAWIFFGVGVLAFSGSLYVWALTGTHWLVFVTPIGGMCLLAGWLWLAIGNRRMATLATENKIP